MKPNFTVLLVLEVTRLLFSPWKNNSSCNCKHCVKYAEEMNWIAYMQMIAKLVCSRHKPCQQSIIVDGDISTIFRYTRIDSVRNLGGKLGRAIMKHFDIEVFWNINFFFISWSLSALVPISFLYLFIIIFFCFSVQLTPAVKSETSSWLILYLLQCIERV